MGMILRAVALLAAQAAAAQDAPTFWAAPDHPLTVRATPGGDAIGTLPPGAQPVEVSATDKRGVWGRIGFGETNGWVALDALVSVEPAQAHYAPLPVGLTCAGVEPFWSLRFEAGGVRAESPDAAAAVMTAAAAAPAAGRLAWPLAVRLGDLTAVLRPLACSDGMSDRADPWTIDVIDAAGLRTGCCRLPVAP